MGRNRKCGSETHYECLNKGVDQGLSTPDCDCLLTHKSLSE